jgi:NAD-dependent dihydropyrimidine dehydrogenase PreA subunit
MPYALARPCVDTADGACLIECPVDCIFEGNMFHINSSAYVDGHACEPVCPVEAILYEEDGPEHWVQYTTINPNASRSRGRRARRLVAIIAWSCS